MDSYIQNSISAVQRHYVRVMAFAVCLVCFLAGAFFINRGHVEAPVREVAQTATTTSQFTRSAPMTLRIPKIDLQATFEEPLGLNDDQTISVPKSYAQVGWYKNGATPGEIGPAVILGHVDSFEGPAVFYNLGQLAKGDEIEIEREDGTKAVFIVESMERVDQNAFPTEKVYGATPNSTLRLITCTGSFNKGEQRYSHNLIVYAVLKTEL